MMEGHFRSTKPKGTLAFFSCWFMAISLSAQTLTNFVLFGGTNGADPAGPLVQGADGNLYGTTNRGGAAALGTIFEVTPGGTLTTLHSFSGALADGSPEAGLTLAEQPSAIGNWDVEKGSAAEQSSRSHPRARLQPYTILLRISGRILLVW